MKSRYNLAAFGWGAFAAKPTGDWGHKHGIDGLYPLDGRADFFHGFDSMRIDDPERQFARRDQLTDQRVALTPMNLLLGQGAVKFPAFLRTPRIHRLRVPFKLLWVHADLPFPLRI